MHSARTDSDSLCDWLAAVGRLPRGVLLLLRREAARGEKTNGDTQTEMHMASLDFGGAAAESQRAAFPFVPYRCAVGPFARSR